MVLLWPTIVRGYQLGMGPDAAVYMWWARVGGSQGLAAVGERPGSAALIASVAGGIRLPIVPAVAGIQYALGAAVAGAGAAIVRGRSTGGREAWILAGSLAGLFSIHLAAGFLANLAFVVPFLAAAATLETGQRRGAVAATILLAGGGLAHPAFFVLGAGLLVIVAAWSFAADHDGDGRPEAARIIGATVGAGALIVAGLAATSSEETRVLADTSGDALLRRLGLQDMLRRSYVARFRESIPTLAPWALFPLSALGIPRMVGLSRRLLVSWTVVTVVGIAVGALTGWFPPRRLLTFGFSLPILSGVAIAWAWDRLRLRRAVAWSVSGLLVLLIAVPTAFAWREASTFISPAQIRRAAQLGRIAEGFPMGTPLVVFVDDDAGTSLFTLTNTANVIRAAVNPQRAADVHVVLTRPDKPEIDDASRRKDPLYDLVAGVSRSEAPASSAAKIVLRPFVPRGSYAKLIQKADLQEVLPGVAVSVGRADPDSVLKGPGSRGIRPSSPLGITLSTLSVFALLWLVGLGWGLWAFDDLWSAAATSSAFGTATLILAAVTVDGLGIRLENWSGSALASALACGGGFALLIVKSRIAQQTSA